MYYPVARLNDIVGRIDLEVGGCKCEVVKYSYSSFGAHYLG